MKAFRFPLQAILTLREEQEQEAQRAYARALHAVEVARESIRSVEREIAATGFDQAARMRTLVPAHELERLSRYRAILEARLTALNRELARAAQEAEATRLALLKASQNRQSLEKYREKLLRLFNANVARTERILLDDLSGRASTLAIGWRQTAPASDP